MVDQDVAYVSPSTVYRVLREEGLVASWPSKRHKRRRDESEKASRPDERWQSDIRHIQIDGSTYYLIIFIDEYGRYVVHHELMCSPDRHAVSLEAQRAIEALDREAQPSVQTDHGSGYVSDEFQRVLSEHGLSHLLIHPYCPEEKGGVERVHRTLDEALDEVELDDYYRGDPEALLEARCGKLAEARHRRKESNLGIQQPTMAFEALDSEVRHSRIP